MAYDKKSALLYAFYEMGASYFKNCTATNDYVIQNIYMHFKDAAADFQYLCEDSVIYSIENVLPKFINKNLEDYVAKMHVDKNNGRITIKTKDFSFDVVVDFKNNKPSIFYTNFVGLDEDNN